MELAHNTTSNAADAALNDELDDATANVACETRVDRHQERIDEHKDQILEHELPAVASIGGINADLLTFAKMMGSSLRMSLGAENCELETFMELAPVLTAFQSLSRQIERNEALTQRIQDHHARMLEMKSRTSSARRPFGMSVGGAKGYRKTLQ